MLDQDYRKILLRLPSDMMDALDQASTAFGMTRSDIIRRSLARDLCYVMDHEIKLVEQVSDRAKAGHKRWIRSLKSSKASRFTPRQSPTFKEFLKSKALRAKKT